MARLVLLNDADARGLELLEDFRFPAVSLKGLRPCYFSRFSLIFNDFHGFSLIFTSFRLRFTCFSSFRGPCCPYLFRVSQAEIDCGSLSVGGAEVGEEEQGVDSL